MFFLLNLPFCWLTHVSAGENHRSIFCIANAYMFSLASWLGQGLPQLFGVADCPALGKIQRGPPIRSHGTCAHEHLADVDIQHSFLIVSRSIQTLEVVIHLFAYRLSILFFYLFVCLSVYVCIYLSIYYIYLSIYLSIYIYLSICLSVCPSIHPSIYIYPSIHLSLFYNVALGNIFQFLVLKPCGIRTTLTSTARNRS